MKLDIGSLSYDPVWYDFGTGELASEHEEGHVYMRIKPVPLSESDVILKDGGLVFTGESRCAVFKKALVAWKNVTDPHGKELPCTDEVKQKIFDFQLGGISSFVLGKCDEFIRKKADDEKN